jgi:hypothetical protein
MNFFIVDDRGVSQSFFVRNRIINEKFHSILVRYKALVFKTFNEGARPIFFTFFHILRSIDVCARN